jgi:hypothetical protein
MANECEQFKLKGKFPWRAGDLSLRDSERCEHCPVADFQLLINVMEMNLDGTVANIQSTANFLVRQTFGHQAHDLVLAVC